MSPSTDPRRWGSLLLCVLVAGAVACAEAGKEGETVGEETAQAETAVADEDAIRRISSNWLEHAQARRADSIAAYFAPDAVVLEQGEPPIEGVQAIRADIEEEWTENPDFTVDWSTTSVQVAASGDMAWERGAWTFDPDGPGKAPELQGEYITVYEKVDGEWKVAADIGVPTEPMPGEEEAADETPGGGEGGGGQ